MPQESVKPETSKVGKTISAPPHKGGLKRKIITTFSGLILVLGILVSAIVYYLTGNALRKQVDLRATAIATNLSDAAAGFVSRKSALETDALIAKYGRLDRARALPNWAVGRYWKPKFPSSTASWEPLTSAFGRTRSSGK
ncbi:MAG: hypothetical protein HYU46_10415 [Deltaproteobacteria bacterium]|nr:hypothetical protein [Deltaproteobacteria bacterium]